MAGLDWLLVRPVRMSKRSEVTGQEPNERKRSGPLPSLFGPRDSGSF
ncbi:hypothetical protein CCACVL1_08948 [Corchorus capsularis]|uniref:Uncharacterized protein n=1 Tax=Corchorus capsularis TaxID=210143 RepID=A0A1R3IY85_COCAP|nr:hypothetical protein CCACVL1_08948 [Corchorus capsularis]